MTREEAKKWGKEIQAFINGATIQFQYKNGLWDDTEHPQWDVYTEYRIKPEAKLVSCSDKNNLLGKAIKEKTGDIRYLVIAQDDHGVCTSGAWGSESVWISYDVLLIEYEFADGSPCGETVNEC